MAVLWVILILASTGLQLAQGFPLNSTPRVYPHEASGSVFEAWSGGAVVPALAVVITAIGVLFGCTWCYRHKDCKPNEGADNQLFTASVTHLHDARRSQPPDSGFSEPVNNNISEDNNNGPISMREMQNIANNNAAVYITSENEERNRVSRESVVEFEPLPSDIRVVDPLERCADWFAGEDFPRDQLQYLREIGRGWFGRVVEGEIDDGGSTSTVAVRILNQNASLEDKARFLDEGRLYRDMNHENVLGFVAKCLQEDPWILLFELCSMDLQQYLVVNRPKMAILNESGVPLQLMCDVTSALAYIHSRGYLYGNLWSGNILVRGTDNVRAVLGQYCTSEPPAQCAPPETDRQPAIYNSCSEVWSLGWVVWSVCLWGAPPPAPPAPAPDLPCPYRNHLYQVMQLCWNQNPESRPSAAQVHALINHLHFTHSHANDSAKDDGYSSSDFEERWQKLKPNTIPKLDEHIAIVHAPSTSMVSHFTGSDQEFDNAPTIQDSLSVELDTAVSRSSSIMSDRDPLSIQIKSDSLTNLHGSLEDVRNIYLTHNETATLECHQGNIQLEDGREREDRSDSSMDPWVKDIINGSQDDVSYYKDVSDVIKNLDNILNSEKTSSSESSHQASPSRDNLSLECKKDYPMQTSMVKSPGISNFQNILDMGFDSKSDTTDRGEEDEGEGDTIGTLSHSFERHSDTISQQTLENLTPDTPVMDLKTPSITNLSDIENLCIINDNNSEPFEMDGHSLNVNNVASNNSVPKLMELCVASMPSVSEINDQVILKQDCQTNKQILDNNTTDSKYSKEKAMVVINTAFINKEIEDNNEITTKMPITNEIQTSVINEITTEMSITNENEKSVKHEITTEMPITNKIQTSVINEITTEMPITNEIETSVKNEITTEMPITNEIETSVKNITTEMPFTNETEWNIKYEMPITNATECNVKNEITTEMRIPNEMEISVINEITTEMQIINEINSIDEEFKYLYENDQPEVNGVLDTESEELMNFTDNFSTKIPNEVLSVFKEPMTDEVNYKDEGIISNKCKGKLASENTNHSTEKDTEYLEKATQFLNQVVRTEQPETVQKSNNTRENYAINTAADDFPKNLDISSKLTDLKSSVLDIKTDLTERIDDSTNLKINPEVSEQPKDSTVYMDLINDTSSEILKYESLDNNVKNVIKSCLEGSDSGTDWSIVKNDSTVYLDLPSVKETHDFLQSEKIFSSKNLEVSNICTSTPKGSVSTESTLEADQETEIISVGKDMGVTLTKLEQRYVPENLSPFDSPSKSHHTDTYDENSSVVLGPFENCTLDLYKGVKSSDLTDLHKEEILALSSNFSEMNLATPSPLRDSNFLNEVPDIVADEFHFDDIATISEAKPESLTAHNTEESEDQSSTEKRVSPLTPPNSPGNFLASTNHQKYIVDIDSSNLPNESNLDAVDVNQIDLQMTTKLAMAENENNMNLEYSGPLSEEGLIFNEPAPIADDAIPESYLAGNKGSVENLRDSLAIDEERMKELRNELELKLPLAQVAGIEPTVDGEWSELPPPPELVLTYGTLSPIVEETRLQLCAYDNDDQWNASTHTDSSASYPEPCNISDEVTDLPTAQHSTYTITKENNHTYTVQKEVPSSKEITMSADSLNASPMKKLEEIQSPIDDRTYNKNDEDDKDANCERLSQVSPFLLSPTTDTSVPESDNVAGVSTLSKTTVPTDAKSSKPSETQCLSKATSIDSWCSNDTLYNVEENFDDLAMDSDIPVEIGEIENDKSESDDTLTHNDDKELSHCSTYIIHDSKSEICETFTPDSITANDNYTYTKVKSEAAGTTPSVITKSDLNSTKNTTKDLAYGTLMSGLPTHSHCTELASGIDDAWKFQQPELMRRSPIGDKDKFTPPKTIVNQKICENENVSPQLKSEPRFTKMESVEITCLKDTSTDANKCDSSGQSLNEENDNEKSPNIHFRNMAHTVTSTPLTIMLEDTDNVESTPIVVNSLPNFQTFFQSAEIRPQDISSNVSKEVSSEILLEGESKSISNKDITDITPGYSDFENSANTKPQDSVQSEENSSQKNEVIQDDFQQFESSVKCRPQDLSSVIDASSLLLKSERRSSEIAMGSITSTDFDTSHSEKQTSDTESPIHNATDMSNLLESHTLPDRLLGVYTTDLDMEEETEQPHSIIITESPLLATKISPNRTFDFHVKDINFSYDSHGGGYQPLKNICINETFESNERVNGLIEIRSIENGPLSDIQYSSISMYSEPSVKESQHDSPIGDEDKFTPPKTIVNQKISENENVSPQLKSEPRFTKMESVETTCLKDTSTDANKCDSSGQSLNEKNENEKSPNIHFRNMAHTVTSTPLTIMLEDTDDVESIPIILPDTDYENSEYVVNSLTNFQTFFQSAEIRPQDISSNVSKDVSSEILLEGESKSISNKDITDITPGYFDFEIRPQDISSNVSKDVSSEILLEGESKSISNKDITDITPGYFDFENSANTKPQDSVQSEENSSQKNEVIQDDFQQFESSVKCRPQDLSSVIDDSSRLLKNERRSSEIAMGSITSTDFDTSHSEKQISNTESPTHNATDMSNLLESHTLPDRLLGVYTTDLDMEEETEQPHSIIITESPLLATKISPNRTFDSQAKDINFSYDSHGGGYQSLKNICINETFESNERVNGLIEIRSVENEPLSDIQYSSISMYSEPSVKEHDSDIRSQESTPVNVLDKNSPTVESIKCNGGNEMYATVNFLNETFEELLESNVDDNDFGNIDYKDDQTMSCEKSTEIVTDSESIRSNINEELVNEDPTMSVQNIQSNGINSGEDKKIVLETNSFLENEKNFCQLDSYFHLLSDIRFTGPATEIMSTSFTQDSPTDPTSPECEQDSKPDPTAEILKEWDSDSDSHSTNSSSGEFIWKDGEGHETALVPSTHFDHQRDSASHSQPSAEGGVAEGEAGSGSGDSGSGSEGDEVEFVPSSWDCRAAPAKSSLRSLEQAPLSNPDIKKRVVFKRQKYHCVYEYPREVTEEDVDSPAAYLPDYSTYSDWDPSSVEETELGYGQLFGGPDPLDLFPLRSGIAFDYDEDFFISSSARPFESLGVMSTTSQFFPGMHVKPMLERELSDDIGEDFPPPPSPLLHTHLPPAAASAPAPPAPPANTALALTSAPSFDFTTPDSGVEDITPGSTVDDDFKGKKLQEPEPPCWRATDSASSSESVSPSSPAAESLGGLRHTRDKLKLDLPPSPHAPSPRHSRVFSFVLDKPRRTSAGEATPDDPAPPPGDTLREPRDPRDDVAPEPTFSTFGKSAHCKPAANPETEKIILTDEESVSEGAKQEGSGAIVEPVKGEGTVLDSGDEDSGIESSSKATLERNKHTPDVS